MKTKIPPPIILLIFGALMWLISRSGFDYSIAIPYRSVLAAILATVGVLMAAMAISQFRSANTTVNPHKPQNATALVRTGIFGRSRNPMYVGLLLVLLAWAMWLSSPIGLLVALLFVPVMNELQIKPEETVLRKLFGPTYDDYCRNVRRWI